MICTDCREAGKLNAEANSGDCGPSEAKHLQEKAHEYHDKCKGLTWCDCQHVVGWVRNIHP